MPYTIPFCLYRISWMLYNIQKCYDLAPPVMPDDDFMAWIHLLLDDDFMNMNSEFRCHISWHMISDMNSSLCRLGKSWNHIWIQGVPWPLHWQDKWMPGIACHGTAPSLPQPECQSLSLNAEDRDTDRSLQVASESRAVRRHRDRRRPGQWPSASDADLRGSAGFWVCGGLRVGMPAGRRGPEPEAVTELEVILLSRMQVQVLSRRRSLRRCATRAWDSDRQLEGLGVNGSLRLAEIEPSARYEGHTARRAAGPAYGRKERLPCSRMRTSLLPRPGLPVTTLMMPPGPPLHPGYSFHEHTDRDSPQLYYHDCSESGRIPGHTTRAHR